MVNRPQSLYLPASQVTLVNKTWIETQNLFQIPLSLDRRDLVTQTYKMIRTAASFYAPIAILNLLHCKPHHSTAFSTDSNFLPGRVP